MATAVEKELIQRGEQLKRDGIVIRTYDLWKTYVMGDQEIHAVSGVDITIKVPSPATSEVLDATSRTICAPMFSSGSFSSISLATVTPSLVMSGEPNFFSITTLRPLGPSVTLTASARTFTPRRIA